MPLKILIVCLDGCDPEYIETSPAPTLDRIAREGFFVVGSSVIPAVTNVNNTSIITGAFPKGIFVRRPVEWGIKQAACL